MARRADASLEDEECSPRRCPPHQGRLYWPTLSTDVNVGTSQLNGSRLDPGLSDQYFDAFNNRTRPFGGPARNAAVVGPSSATVDTFADSHVARPHRDAASKRGMGRGLTIARCA